MSIIAGLRQFRNFAAILPMLAPLLCFVACKPWTVRPIDSGAPGPAAASREFNADSYVDSIWESRLVPLVIEKAVDLPLLLAALDADPEAAKRQYGRGEAGGAAHFIVKGEGRVTRVNSGSRNGAMAVSLPDYKGGTEVVMQVGPVFRGTAIRDAVGFIQFNQFVNQLQYAEVATKLNDRVFASVVKDFDAAAAQGRRVYFHGVFTWSDRGRILITPVTVTLNQRAGGKG